MSIGLSEKPFDASDYVKNERNAFTLDLSDRLLITYIFLEYYPLIQPGNSRLQRLPLRQNSIEASSVNVPDLSIKRPVKRANIAAATATV